VCERERERERKKEKERKGERKKEKLARPPSQQRSKCGTVCL
jgi:hypothetical protein